MDITKIGQVVLSCFIAAFVGGFIGGFAGGFVRNSAFGNIICLPAILLTGYSIGRLLGQRRVPPTLQELSAGCWIYGVLCVVIGSSTTKPMGVLYGIIGGGLLGLALYRGGRAELRRRQVVATAELSNRDFRSSTRA